MTGEVVVSNCAKDYHQAPVEPGDRITWSMLWSCGACPACLKDLPQKCARLFKFGHAGMELHGGYAEYCLLPAGTSIFRIPESLPDRVAAPSNCATATVASAFRAAGSVAGASVVVRGAGMLGITACAIASSKGAASVTVVEPNSSRREIALRFGATHVEAPGAADVVFEFTGDPESTELALASVATGGQLILAGAVFPARPVALDAEWIVRNLVSIRGVYNYTPADLEEGLRFLAASTLPFETLANPAFPLRDINRAIQHAETFRPPRVAIE